MERRAFLVTVGAGLAAVRSASHAQPTPRVARIGMLFAVDVAATNSGALREALRQVGYIEGGNAALLVRSADGRIERLVDLARELVRFGVDVLVTTGSEATQAAKRATSVIPIVFSGPSYPVEEGLVASFAQPGGNITGITAAMSDTVAKQLQLLREIAPTLADAAVVWNPDNPGHALALRDTERAANALRLGIQSIPMQSANDLRPALTAIERQKPGALIVHAGSFFTEHIDAICDVAARLRIASVSIAKSYTERGLLMSYGADLRDAPRRVAAYVDRVLKGAKPGDLPVERPTRFELTVNLRTARALGIAIPRPLLLRADEVIG